MNNLFIVPNEVKNYFRTVKSKHQAVEYINSLPEPEGWPGDVPNPFPLGRSFISPKEWIEYASEEIVSLDNLTSIQPSIDREQVLKLVMQGAPDVYPFPIVSVFPDGTMLIEDGNHRLAAKKILGQKTAKVRLIDIDNLPEQVIFNAMDKGKISMKLFNQLIESIVGQELKNIFKENTDGAETEEPLYHVTYFNRLQNISQKGLVPGSGRSIGGAAYNKHAAQGIFLTEEDGIDFWYSKAEDFAEHNSDNVYEDGLVPIVLRIDFGGLVSDLQTDEIGTQDSKSDAYIHQGSIAPEYIEAWDGSEWIPVEDYWDIDIGQALDKEETEDEDGEPEEYYLFKYSNQNPLIPG